MPDIGTAESSLCTRAETTVVGVIVELRYCIFIRLFDSLRFGVFSEECSQFTICLQMGILAPRPREKE